MIKTLCAEAAKHGYLAKDATGGDYSVVLAHFYGGVVDLTNPEAYDWFKDVIKKNMIAPGCSGGWRVSANTSPLTDTYLQ